MVKLKVNISSMDLRLKINSEIESCGKQASIVRRQYNQIFTAFFEKGYIKNFSDFAASTDIIHLEFLYDALHSYLENEKVLYDELEFGMYSRPYGFYFAKLFKDKYGLKPITDLDKLRNGKRSRVTKKQVEIDCPYYDDISDSLDRALNIAKNVYPTLNEKKDAIENLGKDIYLFLSGSFEHYSKVGITQNILYNNFYGMSAKDFLAELADKGIIKSSLEGMMDFDHLDYKLAICFVIYMKTFDYSKERFSVNDFNMYTAFVGKIAQDKFTGLYGVTPHDDLFMKQLNKNKNNSKIKNKDSEEVYEQITFDNLTRKRTNNDY